jgi:DNA-directed RNA polymerase subunit M/transcription elongation factor TFIIS
MSASLSPTRIFKCDGCQATLPYDPTRAGQKCRCGQCGKVLTVPAADDVGAPSPPPSKPTYIEFWCHVCDTRLVAHAAHAGRKAKCFDCGAINRVPKPKAIEKPREPAAMHGQQYGVWEANKAPDPEQLRAAQAKLFPVYCRVCDTLMYAQPQHVGGKLKCPDCGALTTVKEPPKQPEKKSVLVPAGQEYQLDAKQLITASSVPDFVERLKVKSKAAVEEQAKRDAAERPPMPMFPTFVGVWPMLVSEPLPTWWVGTSAVGIVVAAIALEAATSTGGGIAAMYMLVCMVTALILGVLWFAAVSAIWCAIAMESSEGLKKLHASPSPLIFESFMEMVYIFFSTAISLIPAFAVMKFVDWEYAALVGAISLLLCFPVLLLSSFQESSPMGVVSPSIWGSVFRRPAHWFVFYVQSAIIAAATGVTIVQIAIAAPEWILAAVPVALAGLFIYFRVLGRFAWWLAESLAAKEEFRPEPRYKRF